MWRYSTDSTVFVMVSRYATCGLPTVASTLNSRCIRSTRISKCNSPIPEITVWFVSSSVRTRKVGSSSDNDFSALPNLSWSSFVFGSIATWITGSGNSMRSRMTRLLRSHSVSPVVVSLKPSPATMSPAIATSRSSRWFACINKIRPRRSLRSFVLLYTSSPLLMEPEYTRKYVSLPNGSATILNASAANGPFSSALRTSSSSPFALVPVAGAMSRGLGRKSTTASSIG